MAERILLVGMMGAGKSTVGERLAAKLGWRYLDSDAQVEEATGRTVREIWEADGEPAFRRAESAALASALTTPGNTVVSVAGGAVIDPANRELLKQAGTVIWLRAEPKVLAERAVTGEHRPLLADDPVGTMERLDRERQAFYREVSDMVIDVDVLHPDAVVEQILERTT